MLKTSNADVQTNKVTNC